MNAKDVHPGKWLEDASYPIRVLYDDGEYSIVWGKYESTPALGSRWNLGQDGELGFPNRFGNPTWFVEPDFIATAILQRLLTQAIDSGNMQYYDNIQFAIAELTTKMHQAITATV